MSRRPPKKRIGGQGPPSAESFRLHVRRTTSGDAWMFVHPPCARERWDDLEEVEAMLRAGEFDVAVDELRWLVSECGEFIDAHRLLGQIALSQHDDAVLARGHFGTAFQLGVSAWRRADAPNPLPFRLPSNQAFFEAGRGLAQCLWEQGKREMSAEPLEILLTCDPTDPLGLAASLSRIRGGENPGCR